VKAPDNDVFLDADAIRIGQVVANLLNNASKYTPDGGKITLDAQADNDTVTIKVRDNGIGIDTEDLPHLFEPFYQAVQRSQGGLGIGLTLVRTITEMHGGTVSAHSDGPGKGTEFTMRIPRHVCDETELAAPVLDLAKKDSPNARRVLVVDDNRDAAESLTMLLRFSGHEVVTAHDGLQALADAKEFRPELVLMDLGMPGMNGYEAAKALRDEPWGSEMVLVALTGWGQEEDRKRTKEAGFDRHLVKPIEFIEVQKLFGELEETSLLRANAKRA
jgi:CheY-like chemotaxis protein/anti-sigma regulatory factor (Ser/Thr protein kinase)